MIRLLSFLLLLCPPLWAQHAPELELFRRAAPDIPSTVTQLRPQVPANPGPQADLKARLVSQEAKLPGQQSFDMFRSAVQTMRPAPLPGPLLWGANAKGLYSFRSPTGEYILIRPWRNGRTQQVLIGRFTADLAKAWLSVLTFPTSSTNGVWAGDVPDHVPNSLFVAIARGGDLLLSLDTLTRCAGDRRYGFVMRLTPDLTQLKWVSPTRVSGGRGFAFDRNRLFAVDGGSCEQDYLYELDLASGRVISRTPLPSAQDQGDYIALWHKDLYLILYDQFRHYRLR
ncbi:MAG: hypothetical protein N4A70_00825 [Pelagimonas sp.]|jgi:hypothetical protein|nr:hypothetical protein [Pelagimonas sp.]